MEELNSVQRKYEEKILILLIELNKTNEENSVTHKEMHLNIHKEKLEMFKKQLEILHNENNDYKLALNDIRKLQRLRNLRNKTPNYSNISSDLFSDFEEEDDQNKDPDWRNTPLQLRNIRSRLTFINQNATFNETIQPLKRKSDIIKCSCKGACSTNICTCKKNLNICTEHCKCTNSCENKKK